MTTGVATMINDSKSLRGGNWCERIAAELSALSKDTISTELLLNCLEAAGELKAVRLKILLGRCYEILREVNTINDVDINVDFLKEILEEVS